MAGLRHPVYPQQHGDFVPLPVHRGRSSSTAARRARRSSDARESVNTYERQDRSRDGRCGLHRQQLSPAASISTPNIGSRSVDALTYAGSVANLPEGAQQSGRYEFWYGDVRNGEAHGHAGLTRPTSSCTWPPSLT